MKYIILFTLLSLQFISTGQKLIGDEKEIFKIMEQAKLFSEYVVKSDHEAITGLYTEDGKLFPNEQDIIEGSEEISKYWELPEGVSITHHKISPGEINVIGDIAYDYGYYEGTSKVEDGEEFSWKGKYVVIWKKVNEDWKMYLDIWNNIQDE